MQNSGRSCRGNAELRRFLSLTVLYDEDHTRVLHHMSLDKFVQSVAQAVSHCLDNASSSHRIVGSNIRARCCAKSAIDLSLVDDK